MRVLFLSVFLGLAACGSQDSDVAPAAKNLERVEVIVNATVPVKKPSLSPEANGKKFYKKCIACHLADGAGVPGAFPPLNSGVDILASTEAGRTYLVLVIYNGLRGTLETESGIYNSVMVRQAGGKSPADIADVLNHMLGSFYPENKLKVFSADEVSNINETYGRIGGDKVLVLRPKVSE